MEFDERDELLNPQKNKSKGVFKSANFQNSNKTWMTLVGGVFVVSALVTLVVISVVSVGPSSSSGKLGKGLLGQAPASDVVGQTQSNDSSVPEPQAVNDADINIQDEEQETTQEPATSTTRRRGILDIFGGGGGRRRGRNSTPTVRSSLGRLRGLNLTSRAGREYFGFYNVPYAEKPVGNLRFMPPVPAKSWNGTRDATVKGNMCIQKSRYNPDVDVEGDEDCLHVNIFTPKIPRIFSRVKYPVIVYFFGGGFMHGTANDFNVDYFMDEDVVLVIVESRVGALGFLNTGDSLVTGNMGLKDQVQALRFVKDNIADFGGDPAKVVAFGSSSGAMCSHAHLLSPMSNGLMSGVISFSGTMLTPGNSFATNPRETAQEFGIAMNCTEIEDMEKLISCLKNVSAHDIALNQPNFGPSLETIPSDGNTTNVFFGDTPLNLIMNGNANNVPWLVGVNDAEAIMQSYTMLLDTQAVDELNQDFDRVINNLMGFDGWEDKDEVLEITQTIQEFYFDNETISKDSNTRYNLTNLMSDRFYYHPTKVAGTQHASQSSVYWYYLTKEANVSFADSVIKYFDPPYGVSHADEVQYVFSRPRYPYIPMDDPWFEFSQMFVKFLVSFADTGAPVNPDANGVVWPKVDPADNGTVWYNLDDTPKLVEPFTERLELWDSFPFQLLYNTTSAFSLVDQPILVLEDEENVDQA